MDHSLQMILAAREKRYQFQKWLLARYGTPLISFTLNVPGCQKQSGRLQTAHKAGMEHLCGLLPPGRISCALAKHPPSGSEGYLCVDQDAVALKRLAVEVEEGHPLGRLFDIDVFSTAGVPVSRAVFGLPPRKCLVCGEAAKLCARGRTHPLEELLAAMDELIGRWEGEA